MKPTALKRMIDEMVAKSIRRQLPEIMNEVLVRTIANSGVMREARSQAQPSISKQTIKVQPRRSQPPTSLREIMDEGAGAEFYTREDPYGAGEMWEEQERIPTPIPQPRALAGRIASLPPMLRELAEDSAISLMQEDLSPEESLQNSGFDFSRMRQTIGLTEGTQVKKEPSDIRFEEQRIARLRERLNVKPGA